jgi:CrcB protein
VRKWLFIGGGSFIGAVLRYRILNFDSKNTAHMLPVDTLFINVLGAFALALFLTVMFDVWAIDHDIRHGVSAGLLGAFTTFSTLCKDAAVLLHSKEYFAAAVYLFLSTVLGLCAAGLGFFLARAIAAKIPGKTPDLKTEGDVE